MISLSPVSRTPSRTGLVMCCLALMLCQHQSVLGQIFQNVAPDWGVTQYDWDGIYGAAVSTADWNNDGWPDLTVGSTDGALRTFVNLNGNGFSVLPLPWNMGSETKALIWVDLDNDGDDDLFVQEESGRCGLIQNNGDGTFTNVTSESNLPQDQTEAAGVSFGDMDNDGDLDLHLCRYLELPVFGGASDLNVLMRNDGNLTFTDVSSASGIDVHMRLSFQSIWWDLDEDGWQDIFVINDKNGANAMFRNNGDGTFTDVASNLGLDLVMDAMTASLGDFNQDAKQDLFITNTPFGGDGLGSKLHVQMTNGTFQEVAAEHGLNMDRYCWGALWMDVDNDQDLDLFVAEHEFLNPYGINYLYENKGPSAYHSFEAFGMEVYDIDYLNSHVVASADFDRNGWIDFVVHNVGNHAMRIWLNSGFQNGNSSVGFELQGLVSNRPGIGSKIDVHTSTSVQSRIVHAGENYLSQENEVELFGLGQDTLEHVVVTWPSGLVETFLAHVHELNPWSSHLLVEGHSPCPQAEVQHDVCYSEAALTIESPDIPNFSVEWEVESGENFDLGSTWNVSMGDVTMTASWNGVAMCQVTHQINVVPVLGDLDVDGYVGASDILLLLSNVGCIGDCSGDLNGDSSVAIEDLLMLLSNVGQFCS